jgi:penicillin-binding protein 1A
MLLALVAVLSSIAGLYTAIAGNLPDLDPSAYQAAQTTKIYTDGEHPELLAELHGVEDREIVSGDRIPKVMRDAVVAEEDKRFYEHQGVDFVGILRALLADIRQGEIVQGGSTITQQFIKNAYITNEKTIDRKVKEATLAYQLEKRWSKDRILNEYLNTIYFGEGAYGVEAASKEYFGKHASELSAAEAALLGGIPKSPSNYSPRRDAKAALARRDLILNKMFQQGYLQGEELQVALATPLELAPARAGEQTKVPYWVELVREQLVAKYGSNTVLKGGLRVYTAIDLEKQRIAEEVIADILDQPGDPEAALVSLDVKTGRIVAMVGGQDWSTQKFNTATQGRRQPGSAFKTFVLVTALKQGVPPSEAFPSGPVTVELPGDDWNVKSQDQGAITLERATAVSSNGAYARLMMQVGPEEVVDTAKRMGIETSLQPDPAIALGGLRAGVTPLEMAVAYGTLASGGRRISGSVVFDAERPRYPIAITRVTGPGGDVQDENRPVATEVLDARYAYLATDVLKGVIDSGTGREADIGRPAAGKTGTTQEYRDAWFVGYTPDLVTAVWVGHREEQKEMLDVHGERVTGGSFPARIWAAYMKKALEGVEPRDFEKPEGTEWVSVLIDPASGLLATRWCPDTDEVSFLAGSEPTDHCDLHGPDEVTVPRLIGKSLEAAKKALADLGLEATVAEQEDPESPPGTVIAQDPAAGTSLLQGTSVRLTVARGGTAGGPVPDVRGKDIAEACALLQRAGFGVAVRTADNEAPAGRVIAQDPEAGVRVEAGATVTLTVSGGPPPSTTTTTEPEQLVQVPQVVGLRGQRAATLLQQTGLQVVVVAGPPAASPNDVDVVATQDPPGGAQLTRGSVVQISLFEQAE